MSRKILLQASVLFEMIALFWPSTVTIASEAEEDGPIRPYSKNRWYWE